jgi:hypothetical protein
MDIKEQITQCLNTLNQTQKIILGFVVSLFIILLFAHNPFSGYVIERDWVAEAIEANNSISEECKNSPSNIFCRPVSYSEPANWDKTLPFGLWRSTSPLIDWLGNVRNFIFSIITLFLIGAIFVGFVFSTSNKGKESD